ncbi:MAG: hypothetical protein FWG26_04690 [Betaproteobacteria bacterium]|nr:hypothetical protein [Betaproteobacteria bacterium]
MKNAIIFFAVFFISLNVKAEKDNSIELIDMFHNCVKNSMIELNNAISPAPEAVFSSLFTCMKPFYDSLEEEDDDSPEERDIKRRMLKRWNGLSEDFIGQKP